MTGQVTGSRGIVLVANDKVLEWFTALLASIRATNPDLPVRVIPFDRDFAAVAAQLDPGRDESIWEPAGPIALIEQTARNIAGEQARPGMFRRFAALESPFETALYVDCDVVIASPLDGCFQAVVASGLDWVFTDTSAGSVYADDAAVARARAAGGGREWNSGSMFIRHQPGVLAAMQAATAAGECPRDQVRIPVQDQFFINWWTDRNPGAAALLCDISSFSHVWAGHSYRRRGDHYELSEPGHPFNGWTTPMLHWAGFGEPTLRMPNAGAWLRFRSRAVHGPKDVPQFASDLLRMVRRSVPARLSGRRH